LGACIYPREFPQGFDDPVADTGCEMFTVMLSRVQQGDLSFLRYKLLSASKISIFEQKGLFGTNIVGKNWQEDICGLGD
jgi:hypothetical protein